MKRLFYIIAFLVCIPFAANARIRTIDTNDNEDVPQAELSSRFHTAFIDRDNKIDTLYYYDDSESLVFLLSVNDYTPLTFHMPDAWGKKITAMEGGVEIMEDYMRRFIYYGYSHEEDKNDFRLVSYFNDHLGSVTNDGVGTASWDLITGEFEANWGYYDEEIEELIPMPTIRLTISHKPLYLSMDEGLEEPSLFEAYKEYYISEGKTYEKRIKLYSDNILAFEKYAGKWRMWQTPVFVAEDGTTIYLEETDDRDVYYYDDFTHSPSRKFILICQYCTTPDFSETPQEILKFSRGIIIDGRTGKELLSLFGADVAGEWNDDEWVCEDQILFSPLGFNDNESETETRTIQLSDSVTVHVRQIPQDEYEAGKKASKQKPYKRVEDLAKVQKMLGKRFKVFDKRYEEIFWQEYEVTFKDGDKKYIDNENAFVAYYPELETLLFDCNGGDRAINLIDSSTEGNLDPGLCVVSFDKRWRINGRSPDRIASEGYEFFLEERNASTGRYEKVGDLFHIYGNDFEWIWTKLNKIIFSYHKYWIEESEREYAELEVITK